MAIEVYVHTLSKYRKILRIAKEKPTYYALFSFAAFKYKRIRVYYIIYC